MAAMSSSATIDVMIRTTAEERLSQRMSQASQMTTPNDHCSCFLFLQAARYNEAAKPWLLSAAM